MDFQFKIFQGTPEEVERGLNDYINSNYSVAVQAMTNKKDMIVVLAFVSKNIN